MVEEVEKRVLSARNNKTHDCEIKYVYPTQDMGGHVTCVKKGRPLFLHDTRGKKLVTEPYLYRKHWLFHHRLTMFTNLSTTTNV